MKSSSVFYWHRRGSNREAALFHIQTNHSIFSGIFRFKDRFFFFFAKTKNQKK